MEKLNSTVQSCLLKLCKRNKGIWDEYLESVLFAMRTSRHKSTGYTPFEDVYKRQPNESFSNVFRIYLLVPLTGKPFYPLKSRLQDTEKDERYAFDDIEKRMQMFIAAKVNCLVRWLKTLPLHKTLHQDCNRRRTITEVLYLH